jgi:hypothetical protein
LAQDAVVAIEVDALAGGVTPGSLARVDALVGAAVSSLRPRDTLLLAGVSDRWGEPPQLRVAIAVGSAFPVGTMRSALTRRDGFVQLIDLAPTVVELTGAQRVDGMVGRSWTGFVGTDRALEPRVESFVDADEAAAGYRTYVQPFFILLFVLQVLLYGAAYVALRRLRGQPAQGRIGG